MVVFAVIEGGFSIGQMMPVPLSYFSPLFGGLPGATRMGMEPTYYWDALQPEILDWLNSHTAPGQKVLFCRYPTSWLYLKQTGRLQVPIRPADPGDWAWYVLQNRPGDFWPMDHYLVAHGHPAKVYIKCGVPLLWVFPYDDVKAWADEGLLENGRQGLSTGSRAVEPVLCLVFQTMTRSVRKRSAAASSVSLRLQKQKRTYCRPHGLVLKEAGTGNRGHADVADQVPGESHIVVGSEGVNSRHDVVGPFGCIELEADIPEHPAEAIPTCLVLGGKPRVILAGQTIGHGTSLLKWSRAPIDTKSWI